MTLVGIVGLRIGRIPLVPPLLSFNDIQVGGWYETPLSIDLCLPPTIVLLTDNLHDISLLEWEIHVGLTLEWILGSCHHWRWSLPFLSTPCSLHPFLSAKESCNSCKEHRGTHASQTQQNQGDGQHPLSLLVGLELAIIIGELDPHLSIRNPLQRRPAKQPPHHSLHSGDTTKEELEQRKSA